MTIAVETLSKLERRMTLAVPVLNIEKEIDARLKKLSRTVKMSGFRPGKVPLKIVAQQYGYQIQNEVLNEKLGQAFDDAVVENKLKVAGPPKIQPKEADPQQADVVAFDATFEVYPEIVFGDLSSAEIEKTTATVGQSEIDKTVEILRKQRQVYLGSKNPDALAKEGDKVTVDFEGKFDGVVFDGGAATDYAFVLGQGRMLPEFESATTGLKVGETKQFPLTFPSDYHSKDVAGKEAVFSITLKKLEIAHLPELDETFAKALGVESGDLAKMREDIQVNLEREVKKRTQAKTKESVMDALLKTADFDLPASLIQSDIQRLKSMAANDMQSRGMDAKNLNLPDELFEKQAQRRVKLGLILAELVKQNQLEVKPEQLRKLVEELAQSYEDPIEVIRWYYSDAKRLAEVEALGLEENVVEFVLSKAKVTEKEVGFDELMGNQA